ncbi:MAG: T9SS type A sorting domain-containing protein [Hymenobacter sp.]|nr:MAG: T9SS type A sorting domain-containing protein [Hymenobacter sp.]
MPCATSRATLSATCSTSPSPTGKAFFSRVVIYFKAACWLCCCAAVTTLTLSAATGNQCPQLHPNPPPGGQVTLVLSGFCSTTQLMVVDALGRVVRAQTLPATPGTVTHSLDLSGVAPSAYILRFPNTEEIETRRLVRN